MSEIAKNIQTVTIEDELRKSYLAYAMSVIVGRALPDVRDGLKPVHRRVLFAMHELNNDWNKAYKKSARVVGDVIGKYHPHGDTAVYDTIVRMAQPFSMRYVLVDGQGNFGSVDGDSPAAMRYTEVRMTRLAHDLLIDLEKDTVDFSPNYDGSEMIPDVMPTRVPNLLINGSSGIAVGMATNIPPHNINEVIDGCLALIDNPELTIDELMGYIPGPDFPTAAFINGRAGIVSAYRTGRGKIYLRARSNIEERANGRESIIVTELPYQVNKARLLEKIAELVKTKKIEGISELRDESDKDGMRMVIELKRGEVAEVILNNLYTQTQLQSVFGINCVALVDGEPKLLNLKQLLEAFVRHRREVVTRRILFELRKARERAHILEGLSIAQINIDIIIELIKKALTPSAAKEALLDKLWEVGEVAQLREKADKELMSIHDSGFGFQDSLYRLSPVQAQAILELRLHRLTGLEREKLFAEYQSILDRIHGLNLILADTERLLNVIREELNDAKTQYGDERKSEIITSKMDLTIEDLITEEDLAVTMSHAGYVKAQSLDVYQAQRRGGRGKSATNVKDEDFIERLVIANSHDMILCFSTKGKVYWTKTYQLPQGGRGSRGKPIVNILPLDKDERITSILPIKEFSADQYVCMATSSGTVKKVALEAFSRPRANGIIALDLVGDDNLVGVDITDGERDIMLFTDAGKAIRFHEQAVRAMGRTARGVRGIKLAAGQKVIALIVAKQTGSILTATENGYGKRTKITEYRTIGRGGQGVISIQVSERNGKVIGAAQITDDHEIMLISNRGTLVRTRAKEVSIVGRNTQGVRLIRLGNGEKLISLQPIEEIEDVIAESTDQ